MSEPGRSPLSDPGRSPSSNTVRCEQVVLGWSDNSLLGGDGFGPVFASAGWPLPAADRDAGLGAHARFLDQGAAALVSDGAVPPRCLAYARTEKGSLLISKAYAGGAARPGQYVVHALLDPHGRLGPRDLFACADRGLLLVEQPAGEADGGWPAVEVARVGAGEPVGELEPDAAAALAVLLHCLADRRPMVIASRDAERSEEMVRRLVAVLPDELGAGLSVATFAADPAGHRSGLAVAVAPFSRPVAADLDLDGPVPVPARSTAKVVEVLTAPGPKPGLERVTSVRELLGWASLQSGRLDELGADDLRLLLGGPLWRTWLERVDEHGHTRLLLDALLDADLRPLLAARLADPDPDLAALLGRAVARPSDLSLSNQGVLQDRLVALLGPASFARSVLPAVHRLAKRGRVVVAATALADLVAASADRRGAAPVTAYDWFVDTSTWSVVTEQRLTDWLDGDGPPPASLVGATGREPAGFAAVLDRVVSEQRIPTRDLLTRMRAWPDDGLEVLLVALLDTRRTTRLFVLDVLGARPVELVRPLLRRHWPAIARQADLSPSLAELLGVIEDSRRTRWPWSRG